MLFLFFFFPLLFLSTWVSTCPAPHPSWGLWVLLHRLPRVLSLSCVDHDCGLGTLRVGLWSVSAVPLSVFHKC